MSLASPHTFTPGELLTAANLQQIETNILTNPITLISPTTGAINFNLQTHTGLIPGAITASSASAGQALVASGGATVWGAPTVSASGITIVAGTTGQVFAVTSSNSAPAFQVLPIDGGLSTTVPTAGMVYYVSSSAGLLKGLTIGTSGQVLTVTTSGVVGWATPSASGSGGGSINTNAPQVFADFRAVITTDNASIASTGVLSTAITAIISDSLTFNPSSGQISFDASPLGILNYRVVAGDGPSVLTLTPGIAGAPLYFSTQKLQYDTRIRWSSTFVGQLVWGFTTGTMTTAPTNGVFLLSSLASATVLLVVVSTAGSTTLSAGVTASSFHTYSVAISSSSVDLTVDGAAVGSITAFNPSSGLKPLYGYTGDPRPNGVGMSIDYFSVVTSGFSGTR